ncbi:M20/M25/M40 family metallo-hydrolase [Caenimonas sp. SL110]|uniref:M20/M25/M40 family metallo-hydrolase n=1 Tax=Caenimonas sp. SL110 TaxID=1450524 RepID=UPI0006533F8F|nr:M20/M25/M40 family metallo-hydrolase [Caenimonas sp. SL110]
MKRFAVVLASALLVAGAAQAQLSDVEQRIVAAVKQRSAQAVDLLEKMVRVNSGTLNVEGVREVGHITRAELDAIGMTTRWEEMPASMQRAGHLVATVDGGKGQRVLLLGHLDTVFEKNSSVALWERRGDRVRGQGVGDMKGGNVVILEALRALHSVGALREARIAVLFTGDEERTGAPLERSRATLVELAKQSDAALSFEASTRLGGNYAASIARRSSGGWTLSVRGRPGHSAGVFAPGQGYGAIYEAARILNAFREQVAEPNLTFNPGLVMGGTSISYSDETATGAAFGKTNVIARDVMVRGDLRFLSPEQGERAKQRMREIVAANLPGTTATIEFRDSYPPMPPTEAGQRLLGAYSRVSVDAGFGPVVAFDPGMRGAGDIQFAAPYVPGVDGLGALGSGSHTDDEDLEVASIERGAIRAALMIYRLTRP